jgi:hypothetical protein
MASISIRERALKDGKSRLVLDYYFQGGKRKTEKLDLTIVDKSTTTKERETNKTIKYEFIGSLYDKLSNSNGTSAYTINAKRQLRSIKRQEFIDLFVNRKPVFVLAVLDISVAGTRTLLNNMTDFESNIANFHLMN